MAGKFAKALVVALGVAIVLGGPVRAGSLSDSLVSAYRNSGLLEQNRALLRAADEDFAQTMALLRPVLSYSLGSSYNTVSESVASSLELTAGMTLYDFGAADLRQQIAKESVLMMRDGLRGIEQNILLRAARAFMSVRRDLSIVSLRENNVRLIEQELRAAQDRFEVGEITRTDVAIAEARLASSQAALAAANGSLAASREEFRAATGAYPGTLATPPKPPATASSLAGARTVAFQNHPDMAQAQRSVTIRELGVDLSEAALKPSLKGNARVGVDQDGNQAGSVGLTFSGPIYQGGALASAQRKAMAQRDAARAALHLSRMAVDQNVSVAWAQLTVAEAALKATEQQIQASRVALQGVREEARLGARTTLDVLNAEQEQLDAEASRISAETDRDVAVYGLLSSMGLLTVKHLGLGISTYDPEAYYNAVRNAPVTNVSPEGEKLDRVLESIVFK